MVCQMGEFVARPKYTLAASRENMHKNQCKEFLPGIKKYFFLKDDSKYKIYLMFFVASSQMFLMKLEYL